jgi:dihydrofolate reductase
MAGEQARRDVVDDLLELPGVGKQFPVSFESWAWLLRTLAEPLPWQNSTLLHGDSATAVATLKDEFDGDLCILGSGELVRSLATHGLVDVYTLSIHPLVLGTGTRLFADDGTLSRIELVESVPTTPAVIIATYRMKGADR